MQDLPDVPDAERFRSLFRENKPRQSTGFFDVFFLFLESGSTRWSTSTYRKVRTIYKHLREFEEQAGYQISFKNMDGLFLEKFRTFYAGKGNSEATTFKAINIIVWFINWATGKGYNVNQEYRRFYKTMGQKNGGSRLPLYLHMEELQKICNYQPDNRKMERVRDLFCFMCFTGLRYTELQNMRKDDVGTDEVIVRRTAGKLRRIPLNGQAREIHLKYDNKYYLDNAAFPPMSIITFNKYLRMIGKNAGLQRLVISPGKPKHPAVNIREKIPLSDCLTAGMAIHTFIANAIDLEIPAGIISGFTGVQNDSRVRRIKMELVKKAAGKFS